MTTKDQFIAYKIPACRVGWAGVWDALTSAILGRRRLEVTESIQLKVTFKSDADFIVDQVSFYRSSGLNVPHI